MGLFSVFYLTSENLCAIIDLVRVGGLLTEIRRVAQMYLTLSDYILLTELLLKVIEIHIMCYWFFRNKKK